MKNIVRATQAILSAIALVLLPVAASAQTGYSITDNNRDVTGLDQQYYRFDLTSGQGTLIANLVINGQQIRREYEGLGGTGGVLFGMTEFDTALCNTGQDPITGLSADVRIFRHGGGESVQNPAYPQANGIQDAIGPQIGEMCIPAGFTEGSGAYNPLDGNLYYIASDDLLPVTAPRSKLYRVSPTTGLATQIGAAAGITLTTGSGGDQNPYFDGMAILPNGNAFASEARFSNRVPQDPDDVNGADDNAGLYRVFLTGPNAGRATFIKHLLKFDANRDTGLANNGLTIYLLLEDGRVYTTDSVGGPVNIPVFPAGNPAGSNTLSTPGCLRPIAFPGQFCGDFEGFDIPNNGNGLR